MIQVERLTKKFGSHRAVDDLSFQVEKGEILGLLGKNGAGKTTTMRILAGFFPSTSGRARVAGFDILEKPLEVKKRVGFLPEHPPVYPEMTVDAYLSFVATIKGVSKDQIAVRRSEAKRLCGLEEWGHRLIKHLSKGYRQRVGLAQALIHKPDVLILDEPMVGLDPEQIIEVRNLMRNLSGDHTIIFSTHTLSEVELVCQRVVILRNGQLVAQDSTGNIAARSRSGTLIELEVAGEVDRLRERLGAIPGVSRVGAPEPRDGHAYLPVETEGKGDYRAVIARTILESGCDLYLLQAKRLSLEEAFLELTGGDAAKAGPSLACAEKEPQDQSLSESGPPDEGRSLDKEETAP